MTTALVDADILVYRIGFATEEEEESRAIYQMDTYINEVIDGSGCDQYELFLTGNTNFRKEIFKAYKANRKGTPKPKHYNALRKYLIQRGAVVSVNEEADDLLGIHQQDDTVICSIDKDLLMIPGMHYNFVKRIHSEVTVPEGLHNFYRQLLTGDSTDNIPGIYGMGPKKANDLLYSHMSVAKYNAIVLEAYQKEFPYCSREEVVKHVDLIGKLLYIRKHVGEVWVFDV